MINADKRALVPSETYRCVATSDKELGTVRSRTGVGHAKQSCLSVFDDKVLVFKLLSVDTLSTHTVMLYKQRADELVSHVDVD